MSFIGAVFGFFKTLFALFCNEAACVWHHVRYKTKVVADTENGRVRGYKRGNAAVFKGIPYAADIDGEWRWKAPRKPQPWEGVRNCLAFSEPCPQRPSFLASSSYSFFYELAAGLGRFVFSPCCTRYKYTGSEKGCLSLNVWCNYGGVRRAEEGRAYGTYGADASSDPSDRLLPVMVFVHGGAFILGSGGPPLYRGESFVEQGCILVTVNYRLGLLGYLNAPGSDSNRGMRDVAQALQWVRSNIGHFGGDATKVTLFGESAGAMTCASLMASPLRYGADGVSLFQKVICMSGAAHNVKSCEHSERLGRRVLDIMGSPGPTELATLPLHKLIEAEVAFGSVHLTEFETGERADSLALTPWVDGDVLAKHPLEIVAGGGTADLCLLTGTNRHEYTLFTAFQKHKDLDSTIEARLLGWLPSPEQADLRRRIHDTYRTSSYGEGFAGHTHHRRFNALASDWIFRIPCERLAAAHAAAGGRVHVYRYDEPASASGGASHGCELPWLFGTSRHMALLVGAETQRKAAVASTLRKLWSTFAQGPFRQWPTFDESERAVIVFGGENGSETKVLNAPDDEVLKSWGDLSCYDGAQL
eukprot:Rhum_TRINITY_DN18538_c0_g1::Rhum_TRINITY_DN18538_c0_g1_i1::g.167454::m.167454/K03929/pnbA; para-nitrobenzyl esterase